MSTDTIVLIQPMRVRNVLERLQGIVEAEPREFAEVIERYRDRWSVKRWEIGQSTATSADELRGPGGFAASCDGSILEIYHMMPFGLFACDDDARHMLRAACHLIADAIGTGVAVYMHELLPWEGASLDAVGADLTRRIGPRATSFHDLCAADRWGPRTWYVDDFADLREASEGREARDRNVHTDQDAGLRSGTAKFARVVEGVSHFAEVAVTVALSNHTEAVEVACDGEGWVAQGHVEDASRDGYDDWKAGALAGVRFALRAFGRRRSGGHYNSH